MSASRAAKPEAAKAWWCARSGKPRDLVTPGREDNEQDGDAAYSVVVRQVLVILVLLEVVGERRVVVGDQLVALPLGAQLLGSLPVG
jgi:hypothetical protein